MERVKIGSNLNDILSRHGEKATVHRLSVNLLRPPPNNVRMSSGWFESACQHEERLFGRPTERQLLIAFRGARPFCLDPSAHAGDVVTESVVQEPDDRKVRTGPAARSLGERLEDGWVFDRHIGGGVLQKTAHFVNQQQQSFPGPITQFSSHLRDECGDCLNIKCVVSFQY